MIGSDGLVQGADLNAISQFARVDGVLTKGLSGAFGENSTAFHDCATQAGNDAVKLLLYEAHRSTKVTKPK